MSAFVVSDDHIDALVTFAMDRRVSYWNGESHVTITAHNAEEIGRILIDENERSIRARYDDPTDLIGDGSAAYKFRRLRGFDAVAILKACQCFDYQACETDDYDATLAHRIVNTIRSEAVHALPGYDTAPWEINRVGVSS